MAEIGIVFVLFVVNYLISAVGIIVATTGGVLAIRDKKKVIE